MTQPLSRRRLLLAAAASTLSACRRGAPGDSTRGAGPDSPATSASLALQTSVRDATLVPGMASATAVVEATAVQAAAAPVATEAVSSAPAPLATEPPAPPPTDTPAPAQPATPEPTGPANVASDDAGTRVEALLANMSVEQKVGQLFLVHFRGAEVSPFLEQMIADCHVGGVVLFAIAGNVVDIGQVAAMTEAAQSAASAAGSVPLLVAVDQEGGLVVRITEGATVFPGNMAVGATGSTDMAAAVATVTATELLALGINVNLAPVVDVNSNPANPVIGTRSFGSSTDLVSTLGAAMVTACQAAGVSATAKHFPGHGDTDIDSHVGLPLIPHDLAHLDAVELPPFRAAVEAGVDAVMTAHVELPAIDPAEGMPATLSEKVLQGLLRQQLGFGGVIVSDSLGMGALTARYTVPEVACMAFQAGCDILAFGADAGQGLEVQLDAYAAVLALFTSGALPESRLDASVRRILALKQRRGVLDRQPVDPARLPGMVGTADNLAVARAVAEASVTLVRNDQALLPLAAESPVLVINLTGIGDLAGAMEAHRAGVAAATVSLDPTAEEIAGVAAQAHAYAAVVVATADTARHPGEADLVRAVMGPGLAVVSLRTPYDLTAFPEAPCYLAAYSDVAASLDAVARALCGLLTPAGRLPVDIPGLYALGHGMQSFAG